MAGRRPKQITSDKESSWTPYSWASLLYLYFLAKVPSNESQIPHNKRQKAATVKWALKAKNHS